jgi:hypothetical protein
VRYSEWPDDEFRGRALKNRFVTAWHGREGNLAEPSTNAAENERYWKAFRSGDADKTRLIGSSVPFAETRNYVQRVMENLQVYRVRFGETRAAMSEPDLRTKTADERSRDPNLQAYQSVAR